MQRVGLFFGSFNPIHIGHLMIAEYFVEHTDLKEVWFVVSPGNPFKKKESLLNEYQRLYMVNVAIEDDSRFRSCDIEFKLSYPSYTCHTLVYLKEKYPEKEFAIIMGEDNFKNIHKWKNADYITQNYPLYVYPRLDSERIEVPEGVKAHIIPAPYIGISATFIRQNIAEKKRIDYFLHPKVARYIEEMGIYQKKL